MHGRAEKNRPGIPSRSPDHWPLLRWISFRVSIFLNDVLHVATATGLEEA